MNKITKHTPYPAARRSAQKDDYHGTVVADPYRWLEDPDSAETQQFVEAQTAFTEAYLAELPGREQLHKRLTGLVDYERRSSLFMKAGRYFFWQNDGLQNQPVLFSAETLNGEADVVLDPNELSDDGTSAVTGISLSRDASHLAYIVSHGGKDWQEIRIRDLRTGVDYDEVLTGVRFPQIAWHPEGNGFFYNGHQGSETDLSAEKNKHNKLFWHTLNTPQVADTIIHEDDTQPEWNFPTGITEDGRFLVSRVWYGAVNRNRVYYRGLEEDGPLRPLIADADANYSVIGNDGDIMFVQTNLAAPNSRIVAIDVNSPERTQWREIVAEGADALMFARIVNRQLVLVYQHNAYHRLYLASLSGEITGEVELPAPGSITSVRGESDDTQFFIDFHSFLYPTTTFHFDFASGELHAWNRPKVDFDVDKYETKQVMATSADGTQVPVFVTHQKGIELDGSNPTILYGYGGFSISMTPSFSAIRLKWLELGGVFAVAVLRGGSEFGEAWHQAGMLENKQNVYDDFIASAEALIEMGYTSSRKLAIQGGSNGGLLVAVCMMQRPELFGAVICHVPVIDMLRYHKFTAGRYWVPEYGDPDDPDHFDFMYAYSPMHHVKDDVDYPPTLILTADRDDRVVPMHAHKYAATVQHSYSEGNPILLRFERKAGHGFGKSITKSINEYADVYAFLCHTLDIPPIS